MLKNWLSGIASHKSLNRTTHSSGNRRQSAARRRGFGARSGVALESLEDRLLLTAYLVDTNEDGSVVGDGLISLREAVMAANTNADFLDAPAGEAGPGEVDTISFAAALNGMTITLNGTALTITDDLVITDGNAIAVTIDGVGQSRVFEVADGANSVSISDVTITGGQAAVGGGIYVDAGESLTLENATITNNTATGTAATDGGAGIYNDGGTLTIASSTVNNNSVVGATTVTLSGDQEVPAVTTAATATAEFQYNPSTGNFDIDLFVSGLEINDTTAAPEVTGAHIHLADAGTNGGVIVNLTSLGSFVEDAGGLRLTLNDIAFPAANTEALLSGGTYINVHSSANAGGEVRGQITYATTAASGGGLFNNAGTVVATNSSITGNTAARAGGGIETVGGSVTLTGVNLDNNIAGVAGAENPGNGGGLHTTGAGIVTINGGTVSGNTAASEGGGLWNSVAGTLTVDGTTIDGNSAIEGGGIFNDSSDGTATQQFSLNLTELNGSGVTGTGSVTLTQPSATTREVRVVINATGMEDLTSFGGFHVAHIHGQFAGNRTAPLLGQGDGAFFDGAGGMANGQPPVNSILPSVAANDGVTILDGFLDFLEGRPEYGPVLLNLTSTQLRDAGTHGTNPPDGVPPLGHFLNLFTNGDIDPTMLFPQGTDFVLDTTYTFDLTNADEARQFNNLAPLDLREIVIHGASIDKAISDAIDAAAMGTAPSGTDLGNGQAFRVTAPVAAAEIVSVSGTTNISNATISNNTAFGDGGGIYNETGALNITDTDITGSVSGGDEPGEGGGGIFNEGTLEIRGGIISSNTATVGLGNGGGIHNAATGTLTVFGTVIDGNDAARAGGGIESAGTLELTNVTLTSNQAGINGGGLHVSGQASTAVVGGTASHNVAQGEGGGLWNGSGTMTITGGAMITENAANGTSADQGGAGVFNAGGTINIDGATISHNTTVGSTTVMLSGEQEVPAVTTSATGTADFQYNPGVGTFDLDLLVTGIAVGDITGAHIHLGDAGANGGVIVNLTSLGSFVADSGGARLVLKDVDFPKANAESLFSGGTYFNVHSAANAGGEVRGQITFEATSGSGGGVFNDMGTVMLANTSIAGNAASRAGGGIETVAGTMTLKNVNLDNNIAGPAGAANPGNGGALHITGAGSVTVHNTTVSSNFADNEGAGLWNSDTGTLIVRNSTIVDNDVVDMMAGGGIFTVTGGTTTLVNTIVAGNVAGTGNVANDILGAISTESTNNLISDASSSGGLINGTAGNIVGVNGSGTRSRDSIVGDLTQPVDGSLSSHPLVVGSPAIDAGIDLTSFGITTDQLGAARPVGAAYDIGATEAALDVVNGQTVTISENISVVENQDAVFTVALNRDPDEAISVTVTTMPNTATSGSDFVARTETLTFLPGSSLTQQFAVETVDDAIFEDVEFFTAEITTAVGAVVLNGIGTAELTDDSADGRPELDGIDRFPGARPTLTWQPVPGAVSYEVWVGRVFPDSQRILISESAVTETSYTPGAELDPAFYRFWVRSVTEDGQRSLWSAPDVFEVQPTVVSPATPGFNRRPTFVWDAIPNTSGYELFIRTTTGDIIIDNLQGLSYTPTEDLPDGAIRWWIRSSDALLNRGYSAPADFTFQTTVLTPSGTTANTTPTIAWQQVDHSTRYLVFIQNQDTFNVIRDDNVTETSFTPDTPLVAGNYRVWVKAIGPTGDFSDGLWSRPLSFTIATSVPSHTGSEFDNELMLSSIDRTIQPDSETLEADLVVAVTSSQHAPQASGQVETEAAGANLPRPVAPALSTTHVGSDNEIDLWMANGEAVAELLLS